MTEQNCGHCGRPGVDQCNECTARGRCSCITARNSAFYQHLDECPWRGVPCHVGGAVLEPKADRDEIEHEDTDFPTCPHCGFEDRDWWDGLDDNMNDGDKWESECISCGKSYAVTMCITTTFDTESIQ